MYGKISVNEYGELQFQPKKLSSPFGLHMASSLVKSLAGLVIYFRHLARKNDVFRVKLFI
ncbi:hypothetical protein PN36_01460 [Candidatus Thiomargarita nelsonii]|uniref:Uncharacterized protein n=1 Tax=Candidatus Thiomargarita nelsonii TaxID=1003181 RepID=A0A0A6P4P3_9GAMM|nr:hypothetical protein PN36_01460 [Candidatus Thiomargarita nelsonii]